MEFFIPSIFIMLLALLILGLLIVLVPRSVLLGIAILFIAIAVYSHYMIFTTEYRYINIFSTSSISGMAPFVISGALVALLVGYVLYLFSGNKLPSLPAPPSSMPSPQSATNFVTRNINNGLASLGVPVTNSYATPNRSPNQGQNYLASAVNYRT
jgi:hypothetical protein